MSHNRTFSVHTLDGVVLDASAQGPADQTPWVLLHGFTDSRAAFEPLLAAIPQNQHVIVFSQRGHGGSEKPARRSAYRAQAFADDVIAVLDAVGHQSGALLGHSMGAWVALHCAKRHPTRVAGLALIGAMARFAGNVAVEELAREVDTLTDPVDPAFVRGFQEAASASDLQSGVLDAAVEQSLRVPAHVWRSVARAFFADDVPADLSSLLIPTLLIWGDRDSFASRRDQDFLLRALPCAELRVFRGLGHSPHWERPDLVAETLRALSPASEFFELGAVHA